MTPPRRSKTRQYIRRRNAAKELEGHVVGLVAAACNEHGGTVRRGQVVRCERRRVVGVVKAHASVVASDDAAGTG